MSKKVDGDNGYFIEDDSKKDEKKPKLIDLDLMRTLQDKGFKPKNPINASPEQKIKIIPPRKKSKKRKKQSDLKEFNLEELPKEDQIPNIFTNANLPKKELSTENQIKEAISNENADIIESTKPKEMELPKIPEGFLDELNQKQIQIKPLPKIQEVKEVPKEEKQNIFSKLISKKSEEVPKAFPRIPEARVSAPIELPPIKLPDIPKNPIKESIPNDITLPQVPQELSLPKIEHLESKIEPSLPKTVTKPEQLIENNVEELEPNSVPLPELISVAPPVTEVPKKKGFFARLFGNDDDVEELEPITVRRQTSKNNFPELNYDQEETAPREQSKELDSSVETENTTQSSNSMNIFYAKPKKLNPDNQ